VLSSVVIYPPFALFAHALEHNAQLQEQVRILEAIIRRSTWQ
jgi:hypothetical protein